MKNLTKKTGLLALSAIMFVPSFALAERPSREEMQAERESFFLAADEDESGGLTAAELEIFTSLSQAGRAERAFARADRDDDGELSLEEVSKMKRKKHRGNRPR